MRPKVAPTSTFPYTLRLLAVAGVVAVSACMANSNGTPALFSAGGASGAGQGGAAASLYPAASLRRLTQVEYQNSVSALLGDGNIAFNVAIDPDPSTPGVFSTVVAAKVSSTTQDVTQYEASALDLAAQRFSTTARGQAFVGCTPSGAPNDTCVAGFIGTFGRRTFRRPLTASESRRYIAGYETLLGNSNSVWSAAMQITAAFLESPRFLYRNETGSATGQNVRTLDGYDVASRLSYFLWNSTPDDTLLQAAEDGDLDTTQGLAAQAERLWSDPRARSAITHYYEEWMGLGYLDSLSKDPNVFPRASATIGHAMRMEFDGVVQNMVFDVPQDVTSIVTTRQTYLNTELAYLYGIAGIQNTTAVPYTFPASNAHVGILTMGGMLAIQSPATRTSPTHRGLFVRENLLCQTLPSPPANVPPLADPNADTAPMTMRQRLSGHRSDPSCNSCHALMDPLGLSMEHFDGIGAWRGTDQNLTLDTTGDLDGQTFADVEGLALLVQKRPDFVPCIERKVYAFALGTDLPQANDPTITAMSAGLAAGSLQDFHAVVMALIGSDAFRHAGVQP